jgi:hypothetical protein
MNLTYEQAKEIVDRDSAEKKIAKAKEIEAARIADEKKAVHEFLKRHTGTAAALKGAREIYYDMDANTNMMFGHIRGRGLPVTIDTLEEAFAHLRDTGALCQPPDLEPARVVETVEPTPELKAERIGATPAQLTNETTPNYTRIKDREPGKDSMGYDIKPTHHSVRLQEPAIHLDLTKKQIIAMASTGELRHNLRQHGEPYRREIERIVNGK